MPSFIPFRLCTMLDLLTSCQCDILYSRTRQEIVLICSTLEAEVLVLSSCMFFLSVYILSQCPICFFAYIEATYIVFQFSMYRVELI